MKNKDTVGRIVIPEVEDQTDHAIKHGKREITFVQLRDRLMDLNSPLTTMERMLLAAMIKRISISPIIIPAIAFAGDIYIDMERKQSLEDFQ